MAGDLADSNVGDCAARLASPAQRAVAISCAAVEWCGGSGALLEADGRPVVIRGDACLPRGRPPVRVQAAVR